MTEYAIVPSTGQIGIADVIMGGFESPAATMHFIVEHRLRRCQIVAVEENDNRRFLDGYEQAEVNRSLRLR